MRHYVKLHMKSGKTIRLAVVECSWKARGDDIVHLSWTHPRFTLRRLKDVKLDNIEALTRGFF